MRFKLDENLSPRLVKPLFDEAGWDVQTTGDEGLDGADDATIGAAAQSEGRVLVTMDLHFGDVRKYAPADYHGIVLLRPAGLGRSGIMDMVERAVYLLKTQPIGRQLWIVEPSRVRVRE